MIEPNPAAQLPSEAARRAKDLWTVTGLGLLLYIVFHVLSMLLVGVPAAFEGKEDNAMWTWTIVLSVAFLPVLIAALGQARGVAWTVFIVGIFTVLLALLIGFQYGLNVGAGYIALIIAAFVLIPAVLALAYTLRWARGK